MLALLAALLVAPYAGIAGSGLFDETPIGPVTIGLNYHFN